MLVYEIVDIEGGRRCCDIRQNGIAKPDRDYTSGESRAAIRADLYSAFEEPVPTVASIYTLCDDGAGGIIICDSAGAEVDLPLRTKADVDTSATASKGIIHKSPDGLKRIRRTVDNAGNMVSTEV